MMQTLKQIREDLQNYASSLDISGVAVDRLCSLLAYSVYKNQVLQAETTLEASFSTSTKLNSRIHHAASMLYSVPRGNCPTVEIKNIRSIEKKTVEYLDFVMLFNGYYFYNAEDATYGIDTEDNEGTISVLNLICSSKSLKSTTVNTSDSLFYVDFISAENVSQDYYLMEGTNRVSSSEITEDSSLFYYKDYYIDAKGDKVYKYQYKYLVITLPSYGIRVIRHSDSKAWDNETLTLTYLPYSETTPTLTSLSSVPGFSFISDTTTGAETYTEVTVNPFKERLSDLTQIYSNATSSFLQQGTVATTVDLLIALKKKDSNGTYKIINDVKITKSGEEYSKTDTPLCTTVVYFGTSEENVTSAVTDYIKSLTVPRTVVFVEASPLYIDNGNSLYVKATTSSKLLTNEALLTLTNSYTSMIGETLDHSKFEADIIRLGFDTVKVYTDSTCSQETSFSVTCEDWQYPALSAKVVDL